MLFYVRETFFLNNSTFASWLYFFTIKNNVVNYNWNRVDYIIWLTSSLKNISLNFEFSLYILLCFWISSIVAIFVVYYVFSFNVLKLFMNNCRILFLFFIFNISSHILNLDFFQICVMKYKTWRLFFMRIIARK